MNTAKWKLLLLTAIVLSFGFGMAVNSFIREPSVKKNTMKKVTGIGGIFFKCKNPSEMKQWYKDHLGLETNEYGASFEWKEVADTSREGITQWSPFTEKTTYFEPSVKDFMINYRVDNLENLVAELRKEGVTIVDEMETYDYGKFIHIMDIEGNKIELWEPLDHKNDKSGKGKTK